MIWTPIAASLSVASSVATFATMVHLRCKWDVHASSVRWLFWFFFLCICLRCSMRAAFYVWLSFQPPNQRVDKSDPGSFTYGQLDRLGIHGVQFLPEAKTAWITATICAGDLALAAIAITLFPLTYELTRLARYAMDRGVVKEQARIRIYTSIIGGGISAYAAMQLVLTIVHSGYNIYTYRALLCVYGVQVIGLVYMVSQLVLLKVSGRKYETIHGVFVASPVYKRLKLIMLVYAFFTFQFQISMILIYLHDVTPESRVLNGVGVSLILHNSFGLAVAIVTSCSQACIFSTCATCIPEDLEAQFTHKQFTEPVREDLEAPRINPVFVYTDIESSTALWSVNSDVMALATEIHDTILRSSLLKHRGYEITTVGDAFQMAFHTIGDAVEYCMDVQLQLLVAQWPKEIQGAVPATSRLRVGRRVLFNGLRVRMGIHDAAESDGQLVQDVHVVTRKTMYTGVSELIAEFLGDLGGGGQILVTDRVATWLKHHREDLSIDMFMEYVGAYAVPHVNTTVEVYQVQPTILAQRARHFAIPTAADGSVDDSLNRVWSSRFAAQARVLSETDEGSMTMSFDTTREDQELCSSPTPLRQFNKLQTP